MSIHKIHLMAIHYLDCMYVYNSDQAHMFYHKTKLFTLATGSNVNQQKSKVVSMPTIHTGLYWWQKDANKTNLL